MSETPQHQEQSQLDASTLPTFTATPSSVHSTFGGASGSASFSANGDIYETNLTSQADLSLDSFIPPREMDAFSNLNSFPAFFEQVMLPSLIQTNSIHETQQPRVFDFMQDTDFTLAEHDIFGTDFIPDLDRIFDPKMPLPGFEGSQQPLLDDQDSARRRAAAFQRSLWYILSFSSCNPSTGFCWALIITGCGCQKRISMPSATKEGYPFEIATAFPRSTRIDFNCSKSQADSLR